MTGYREECPQCGRTGAGATKVFVAELLDARGIYCGSYCDKPGCYESLARKFRAEVLTDSQYEADEPIDPED